MFLSEEDIQGLTGKRRRSSQAQVLNALGVIYKVRPDGSLVILRSHIEQQLGGRVTAPAAEEFQPNWAAATQSYPPQKKDDWRLDLNNVR